MNNITKLFIIGNGFDRGHNLPTGYDDFYKWLKIQCVNYNDESYDVPYSTVMPDGDIKYDIDDMISFICKIINNATEKDWNSFEEALGKLDFSDYFNEVDWDDEKPMHAVYNNEDITSNILNLFEKLPDFFAKWISNINISTISTIPEYIELFSNGNSKFLTFNYTRVLEDTYSINTRDICHIHGEVNDPEHIVLGHGDKNNIIDDFPFSNMGVESNLSQLHEQMRKDTAKALNINRSFFSTLSGVNEIYSFGFSFSEVDLVYIEAICNSMDTRNIIWFLDNYSRKKHDEYKRKIRNSGFEGQFSDEV